MDYKEAARIIDAHAARVSRSKGIVAAEGDVTTKKLKGNTWLTRDVDGYRLRYHKTNILKFHPLHFDINDGGFFGHSTHQRLNEFMPKGFHVSGCTYPNLRLKRPLGFLRTPIGVFPYNMPAAYYYDGRPCDHQGGSVQNDCCLTNNARIVSEVPAYVDHYLSLLVSGKPCSVSEQNEAEWFWTPTNEEGDHVPGLASRNAAIALYTKRTYAHLATVVAAYLSVPSFEALLPDIPLHEFCEMLVARGAELFKKPRTKDDSTRRLEDVLYFGRSIPNVTIPVIKKNLRQLLIEFIVSNLGFEEVEWHKRPQ